MGCTGCISNGSAFPDGINILLKNRDNADHVNPKPFYSNIGHYDAPPYQYVRVYDPGASGSYGNQGMNVRGLIMTQHVLNGSCTCCGAMPLSMGEQPKLRPGKMPDEDDAYEFIPEHMPMVLSPCTDLTPEGQEACEAAGCYWYFDSCHTYPPNFATPLSYCEHAEDALDFVTTELDGTRLVGFADRFGVAGYSYKNGSQTKIEYVENDFYGQGNEWHCCDENYPDYGYQTAGCNERCSMMNYRLYESYGNHGYVGFHDVVRAARDQHYALEQDNCYNMNYYPGDFRLVGNLYTQTSFAGVNITTRYDGKLGSIWTNYGRNCVIGIFMPLMIFGDIPPILIDGIGFNTYVNQKRISAQSGAGCSNYWYKPERVREIQQYSFYAEDWGWQQYLNYLVNLPDGFTDQELWDSNSQFNLNTATAMANIYINEELPRGIIDDIKTFTIEVI